MIYTLVAVFYVAMIITYALVVHKAADDGANIQPCNEKTGECGSNEAAESATKQFATYATSLFTLLQDSLSSGSFQPDQQ